MTNTEQIAAMAERIEKLEELLQRVIDYSSGKRPYDFSRLPAEERDNATFDAWLEIETAILALLSSGDQG